VVEVDTPAALFREAAALASQGRLEDAASAYQRALARWPQPDAWYNLGLLQRRLGHIEAALECYAQALRCGVSRPEEVHLNRGVIYADCLRQDGAAERELRASLAINPAYLPALQNLANLHEDLGRRGEALATYERMLELDGHAFEALARYAQLKGSADEALLAQLRAALAHQRASAADQASLGFVLARLLDSAGRYEEAFAAASAANLACRASAGPGVRYDRTAHEHFIDRVIAAFPRPHPLGAGKREAELVAATGHPRPIFICGMMRSGSTLTERLLAGSTGVVNGGELDLLPRLARSMLGSFPISMTSVSEALLGQLASRYLEGVAALFPGAACVTDKWVGNFIHVGLIHTLFPNARIVHTTRDPLDTCLSIFFLHLDPQMPWALDLRDIGHYFRQYRRLMAHWQSLYGEAILEFNYDDLVGDPRPAVQRLLEFCDLEWSEACLDFSRRPASVKTASVWQVREALYQRSSGRAHHYARYLEELAADLSDP
jgi:Sulfotransferase family/Tetratricopeptide repeat